MAWHEIEIAKWSDLVKEFDSFDYGRPSEMPYLFRGQSDAEWPLVDTLAHVLEPVGPVTPPLDVERMAHLRFIGQAHLFLDPSTLLEEKSLLAWWGLMQHFGCPTRLLDWTSSPFVAAYFAVVENWDRPGAVWAFDAGTLVEETKEPNVIEARKALGSNEDIRKILWQDSPLEFVHPFFLKRQHTRTASQQGAFTVCGRILADHGQLIDDSCPKSNARCCLKMIMEPQMKSEALRHLMRMNITANSLFPGLDGLGRSINELIRLDAEHLF